MTGGGTGHAAPAGTDHLHTRSGLKLIQQALVSDLLMQICPRGLATAPYQTMFGPARTACHLRARI